MCMAEHTPFPWQLEERARRRQKSLLWSILGHIKAIWVTICGCFRSKDR